MEIVKLLMEHNANPKLASQQGATPCDIAAEYNQIGILEVLIRKTFIFPSSTHLLISKLTFSFSSLFLPSLLFSRHSSSEADIRKDYANLYPW